MSNVIGKQIAAAGHFSANFGDSMLKDLKAEQFGRLAAGKDGKPVQSNHPAWVFGHLAMYPSRCMDLLGQPQGVTAKPAGWDDLFKNGTECKDDLNGTIYPPMSELVKHCQEGYRAVLAALPNVPDEVFNKPNPAEGRFKEMFPTVGAAVTFLVAGHTLVHLGQVSAWRRFMGLGSAA